MFCEKCGNKVEDGVSFCPSCGAQLAATAANQAPVTNANQFNAKETVDKVVAKAKTVSKKTWAIIAAVLVVLIVVVTIVNNKSKTINLNDYLVLEFDGTDGDGYATCYIDWDEIEDDFEDKIELTSKGKKAIEKEYRAWGNRDFDADDLDGDELIDALRYCVDVELSDYYYLSNGDTVKYRFDVEDELDELDMDIEDVFNIKLKYENGKEKVTGLR